MRAAEGRQSAVRSHNPTAQSTGTAELTHSSVNTHHHHTLTSTPDQHIPSSHAIITPPAINYPLSVNWINEDLPNWQYHHHRHLICYKWLVLLIISLINSKTKHIIFKPTCKYLNDSMYNDDNDTFQQKWVISDALFQQIQLFIDSCVTALKKNIQRRRRVFQWYGSNDDIMSLLLSPRMVRREAVGGQWGRLVGSGPPPPERAMVQSHRG